MDNERDESGKKIRGRKRFFKRKTIQTVGTSYSKNEVEDERSKPNNRRGSSKDFSPEEGYESGILSTISAVAIVPNFYAAQCVNNSESLQESPVPLPLLNSDYGDLKNIEADNSKLSKQDEPSTEDIAQGKTVESKNPSNQEKPSIENITEEKVSSVEPATLPNTPIPCHLFSSNYKDENNNEYTLANENTLRSTDQYQSAEQMVEVSKNQVESEDGDDVISTESSRHRKKMFIHLLESIDTQTSTNTNGLIGEHLTHVDFISRNDVHSHDSDTELCLQIDNYIDDAKLLQERVELNCAFINNYIDDVYKRSTTNSLNVRY